MTGIGLRAVTPADSEFCFQLHKAAMASYITAIWGWDEQVQRDFHTRAFAPDRWQIITADGADIGVLDVEYRPCEIYLARVEIHPEHQGRGVGTRLSSALIDEGLLVARPRPRPKRAHHQPARLRPLPPARHERRSQPRRQAEDHHAVHPATSG